MKKLKKNPTLILAASLAVFAATLPNSQAHEHGYYPGIDWSNTCIDDTWIPLDLDPSSVVLGTCQQSEALLLAKKEMNYPRISGGPFPVGYWKGGYERKVTAKWTYLHQVVDRCSRRVLVSENKSESIQEILFFGIKNPNLDPGIYASYEMLPMTEAEAREALANAKEDCEIYSPSLK